MGGTALTDLAISLATADDSLVEGPENYTVTIAAAASGTGSSVLLSGTNSTVTTTVADNDSATWSLTGAANVNEGSAAAYTLALAGTLQENETATINLTIAFPGGTTGAVAADFTGAFLADVDTAIAAYAGPGTIARSGNILTYTGGVGGTALTDLAISLATADDSLVEGPENYTVTIAAAASGTGSSVLLSGTNSTVTTTVADNDSATWSLTGAANVNEGSAAAYTLALAGTLQENETATINLTIAFPGGTTGAVAADFTGAFLAMWTRRFGLRGPGTIARSGNILTYTGGVGGTALTDLAISLATADDSLVEGPENYTVTIAAAASGTGSSVLLSGTNSTVTTTVADNDSATWSLTGAANVNEGSAAAYTLALAGTLQGMKRRRSI